MVSITCNQIIISYHPLDLPKEQASDQFDWSRWTITKCTDYSPLPFLLPELQLILGRPPSICLPRTEASPSMPLPSVQVEVIYLQHLLIGFSTLPKTPGSPPWREAVSILPELTLFDISFIFQFRNVAWRFWQAEVEIIANENQWGSQLSLEGGIRIESKVSVHISKYSGHLAWSWEKRWEPES